MANYGVSATASRPFSLRPIPVEENKSKDVSEKAKKPNVLTNIFNTVLPRNPVHKHREFRLVPLPIEIAIGKHLYGSMVNGYGGHYHKRNYEGLMKTAGEKLSKVSDRPDLPWQFSVIDSNTINAWCLPGGKIGFYKGLIERMDQEKDDFGVGHFSLEAKVAAVLGHEITHAAARHTARGIEFTVLLLTISKAIQIALHCFLASKMNGKNVGSPDEEDNSLIIGVDWVFARLNVLIMQLLQLHSSRSHEYEADKYGMVYLARAGFPPKVAIWLQKFMAKEDPETGYSYIDKMMNLFSTHPNPEDRVKANEKTLEEINQGILK